MITFFPDNTKTNNMKEQWMIRGWMMAKWQWDETTEPGQIRRYPSKGSLGRETKEEKRKRCVLSFFRKREGEREIRCESRDWEEVACRRKMMQVRRKTAPQSRKDLFAIFRRELLEGRLSVTWEDERVEQLRLRLRREGRYEDDQSEEFHTWSWQRENSVLNSHINFEPVKRFKNRRNVMTFRSCDSTSSSIWNKLQTFSLSGRNIQ
jgi:hypothetical protein